MNSETAGIESKISEFTQRHELEWRVICGLKRAPFGEIQKILQLLRDEQLLELEAMLIWKIEYLQLK